jgi:hypothetical protein
MNASKIRSILEVLCGAKPIPPPWVARGSGWAFGVWWLTLFLLVVLFAGRTSKFVYVDF